MFDKTTNGYLGTGNRAVEKLAEELAQGLAKESPLESETKRDGRGKEFIGGAFRNPLRAFTKAFLAEHERSINEIWIVHQRNTGALSYGNMLNFLEGRGGRSYQEAVAEYSDMEKRYNDWYELCRVKNHKARDACINVFGRGMNFKLSGLEMETDRESIKILCVKGLHLYSKVSHG